MNIKEFAFIKNKYRWTSVLAGHYDEYGKPDISHLGSQIKKVLGEKFENIYMIDKMIFRGIVLNEHIGWEGKFLREFELVEILGCEVKDDLNEKDLIWFDLDKLTEMYINNYAEFTVKLQQALPLVLRSFALST